LADWSWLQQSGLIGADGLVRDHLDVHCRPTGPAWSYTQGTMAAGLTALAASGQAGYLAIARHLADAATTSTRLNPAGILTDPCETSGGCAVDGPTFKGAAVRGLGALNRALPDHPYTAHLTRQAATMFAGDRLADNTYGQHWTGPAPWANAATQGSAVDLLTATMGGV
jgi:predicted alpha-1,6-mannanase (GH76 family)